jgi:piezo-type mechanosensitive ion channel component 1/2
VYQAIPFAVELRCLLDFTFSKTSLDIFQFW